jgi:hypothetical protein
MSTPTLQAAVRAVPCRAGYKEMQQAAKLLQVTSPLEREGEREGGRERGSERREVPLS